MPQTMHSTNFYSLVHDDVQKIRRQTVAIIGGGGKSSLLKRLARELLEEHLRVIVTSTTKFQAFPKMRLVLQKNNPAYLKEVEARLDEAQIALVASDYHKAKSRLLGVDTATISQLKKHADIVLIEADGSRQRGLKTHRDYEPVIPKYTKTVIIICSADIVGESLGDDKVHRAELFARKWKLSLGAILTPEIIARELLSPHGYMRNVPIKAKVIIFINKSDRNSVGGKLLAERLVNGTDFPVFLGSLKRGRLERVTLNSTI